MATENTSTHKMVGTARATLMNTLMALLMPLLDRLQAASSPSTNAITAPMNVVRSASASDTNRPSITSGSVKCPPSPGCVIMVTKSSTAASTLSTTYSATVDLLATCTLTFPERDVRAPMPHRSFVSPSRVSAAPAPIPSASAEAPCTMPTSSAMAAAFASAATLSAFAII